MKKLWIVTGLLIGAGIGYYLYQEGKRGKARQPKPPTDEKTEPEAFQNAESSLSKVSEVREEPVTELDDSFPLKIGSQGKQVERLQVWLLRNLGLGGSVDGHFDCNTQRRLHRALGMKELDKDTYIAFGMGMPVHEQKILR